MNFHLLVFGLICGICGISGSPTPNPQDLIDNDDAELALPTPFPEDPMMGDDSVFGSPTPNPLLQDLGWTYNPDIVWATTMPTVPISEIDAKHQELEDELIAIECWEHRFDEEQHPRCEDTWGGDIHNPIKNTTDPRLLRRQYFFHQINSGVQNRTKAELVLFCFENRFWDNLRAECYNITWNSDILNGGPPTVYTPEELYKNEKEPDKYHLMIENYMEFLQEESEARECYVKQVIKKVDMDPLCEGITWGGVIIGNETNPRLIRLQAMFKRMDKENQPTANISTNNFPQEGADFQAAIDCFNNRHDFPPPASCKWILWDPKPKSEPELAAPHRALRKAFYATMEEDYGMAADCYLHHEIKYHFSCDGITFSQTHIQYGPPFLFTRREKRRRQFYKELMGERRMRLVKGVNTTTTHAH